MTMRFIKKQYRRSSGFTLVEVMVAITILMIVILPLASLYVKSLTTIQGAALYSQALGLAKSRMELITSLEYADIDYTNPIFCPGFPFTGGLLPYYSTDGQGDSYTAPEAGQIAYDNRDIPETTDIVERYFDPTGRGHNGTNGANENYPVPVYRDYYNNFTGQLIDPNYNGLCDDDLNGDGVVTQEDIFIGNPNGDVYDLPGFPGLDGLDKAGDGLFDTVVEGMYVNSYDQTLWRKMRAEECVSPIIDFGLQFDEDHSLITRDFRHREKTFQNFVRMTTIIDPTPRLADPNHEDAFNDWVDQYYFWDRRFNDSYTDSQLLNLSLCLERDLPLNNGTSNLTVGTGSETVLGGWTTPDVSTGYDGTGLEETDPFKVNYSNPLYGKKVIVTVFYLSGEGEVVYEDLNGDGIPEEMPSETYAGAKRVSVERIFVNDMLLTKYESLLNRDPTHPLRALVTNPTGIPFAYSIRMVPPQRRFIIDPTIDTADGIVTTPDITSGDEYDPCAYDNDGLPYYSDRYWF